MVGFTIMLNLDSRSFLGVCEVNARLHSPALGLESPIGSRFALTVQPVAEPFGRVITHLFCSFVNLYEWFTSALR